ncbi:hypothetical protein [Nostoc sp. FACHB-110]|nr:hypothetical protein [Nostoc sp. FACHB-110]MBD2438645.1 hypothetical protein [Nostoc sp. FACHB-110]
MLQKPYLDYLQVNLYDLTIYIYCLLTIHPDLEATLAVTPLIQVVVS